MNLLYMVIFLLFCILILLITKFVTGKKLISSITIFIFTVSILSIGILLDSVKDENTKGISRFKSLFITPIAKTSAFIEENLSLAFIEVKDSVLLDAPVIKQMPELPRGCEVTSLAMMLQYAGIQADKMVLAQQIKKDPTPYRKENGIIYFGHPNNGFVGDMYSYQTPGLGVYHRPITKLAEQYLPGRIHDLTGSDFQEIKKHLSDGRPVWVIINTAYRRLDKSYFQTWQTPSGPIDITYKEHSVLITGYDANYVYFNDPLTGEKNKKAPITDFEESWVQMGRQAITYLHNYPLADKASEV
nr:C39 family peptidase [uncultured Bacillus sp.]